MKFVSGYAETHIGLRGRNNLNLSRPRELSILPSCAHTNWAGCLVVGGSALQLGSQPGAASWEAVPVCWVWSFLLALLPHLAGDRAPALLAYLPGSRTLSLTHFFCPVPTHVSGGGRNMQFIRLLGSVIPCFLVCGPPHPLNWRESRTTAWWSEA